MILRFRSTAFLTLILMLFSIPEVAFARDQEMVRLGKNENLLVEKEINPTNGFLQQSNIQVISDLSEAESELWLEIQTVPPLGGIQFALDGEYFESSDNGVARISIPEAGVYTLEVYQFEEYDSNLRLEFARWGDGVFTQMREIDLQAATSLEVGFHVSHPLKLEFVDLDGNPVAANRITSVEIRNSLGDIHTFPGDQEYWMQAGKLLGRDYGLELVDVVQTVQSVITDGSNVVNRGQQRFVLLPDETQIIEILLYPAKFRTTDAFFGFPIGKGIHLQYPDGHTKTFDFQQDKTLQLDSLARGTYRFRAAGVLGYAPETMFVLSQPQEVSTIVVSIWDLLIILMVVLVIFPGLLIIGRPDFRNKIMRVSKRD